MPHTSRGPAIRRAAGFTIIELMIVVAIVGVVAAIAVPAFNDMIKNNRRTTVVNELLANLMTARAETAKSGRQTIVCPVKDADADEFIDDDEMKCTEGTDWSDGWIVSADDDRDGTSESSDSNGKHDSGEIVIAKYAVSYPDITILGSGYASAGTTAGVIVLRPFNAASTAATLTICDSRKAASARAVIVEITGRGRSSDKKQDGTALSCS